MTDLEKVNVERISTQLGHEIQDLEKQANRLRQFVALIDSGDLTYMQIMRAHTDLRLDSRITAEEAVRLATLPQ